MCWFSLETQQICNISKINESVNVPKFYYFLLNIKDYENRPEAYNLLSIYSDLLEQKIEVTINEFVGKDFSSLKEKLSEKLVETISPIGKNISKLMKDKKHLEDVLKKGKQKASIIAEENLKKIRDIVGLI